ncbi:ATP-dependent DNA helicase [Thiomicrospira microaerophila]|uniref:ATP-dependent DNA helicase n=1 Tax=Thiomicrospira microaerophila TaxID=406020 RepID=UPI0005CA6DFC|nr:AAA family ATPase [Thiomicrospira microaerophila]
MQVDLNFSALQSRWYQLYEHASFASSYVHSDPHAAIVKLRCYAETLVGILYRELNLTCDKNDGFFEKIKSPIFTEIVNEEILAKLHAIRIIGNKAAHGKPVSVEDALVLHKDAYLLGQWIYKTFSGSYFEEYPIYQVPKKPHDVDQLIKTQDQLADRLRELNTELQRLETSEKAAQQKINELKKEAEPARLEAFKTSSHTAAISFDLESQNTQDLITLHDAFATYELTTGQADLVNHLSDFLTNRQQGVFLLKGYAGTGKTFITKGLTEYFRATRRNYILAAPTGKASRVIAQKTESDAYTIHKTIYSFKDIEEYKQQDLDGSETYKFYTKLAVNTDAVDTVYIVDEASMVSNQYQEEEFFRFGSGYLLQDFLEYVNLDHNDHRKKIIFIGDNAQLPPVKMKFSPALDLSYLSQNFNIQGTEFELTDVVRQKSDSGVMQNSINLRDSLKRGRFNQLVIDFSKNDIDSVGYDNLIDTYLESCHKKINKDSIIIAYSNAEVYAYNQRVREYFFPNCEKAIYKFIEPSDLASKALQEVTVPKLAVGDKIMAVQNNKDHGLFISNGDFGMVLDILSGPEERAITLRERQKNGLVKAWQVILYFQHLYVAFRDHKGKVHRFETKIIENLLYSDQCELSSDERKALYIDFCIRHPELRSGTEEFKGALRSDPYFNAMRIKFGYAITCHKAQGSEWKNVFVKCSTTQSQLNESYFRWLYTAMTRTSEKLYLLDPPNLKIGSGIKRIADPSFTGQVEPIMNSPSVNSTSVFTEPTSENNLNVSLAQTFGIVPSNTFAIEILNRVQNLISGTGIQIQSVNHNQYMESYFFEKGNEISRIDIGYNGKKKITHLNTPHSSELSNQVKNLLSPLKNSVIVPVHSSKTSNILKSDKDFIDELLQRIQDLASKKSILLSDLIEQQWNIRLTFSRSIEVAVFDIYFNKKFIFSSCGPVKNLCNSGTFIQEVDDLIINGLGS